MSDLTEGYWRHFSYILTNVVHNDDCLHAGLGKGWYLVPLENLIIYDLNIKCQEICPVT